jgi:hypothetical protein
MTVPDEESARKHFENLVVDYLFKTFLFCGKREENAATTLIAIPMVVREARPHISQCEILSAWKRSPQSHASSYAICQPPRIAPIAA